MGWFFKVGCLPHYLRGIKEYEHVLRYSCLEPCWLILYLLLWQVLFKDIIWRTIDHIPVVFPLRPCDHLIVMHLPCVADTIFDQRIDYTSIWYLMLSFPLPLVGRTLLRLFSIAWSVVQTKHWWWCAVVSVVELLDKHCCHNKTGNMLWCIHEALTRSSFLFFYYKSNIVPPRGSRSAGTPLAVSDVGWRGWVMALHTCTSWTHNTRSLPHWAWQAASTLHRATLQGHRGEKLLYH